MLVRTEFESVLKRLRDYFSENGRYKLLAYNNLLEENSIILAFEETYSCAIAILQKLVDLSWVVCPGVQSYS